MIKILTALLLVVTAKAQIQTNFGAININHAIQFTDPNLGRTDLTGYNVYVFPRGNTSQWEMKFTLSLTNEIPATSLMAGLPNGKRWVAVEPLALANLTGPRSFCEVDFNNGQLQPVFNYQLFLLAIAKATNSLPSVPPIPTQ